MFIWECGDNLIVAVLHTKPGVTADQLRSYMEWGKRIYKVIEVSRNVVIVVCKLKCQYVHNFYKKLIYDSHLRGEMTDDTNTYERETVAVLQTPEGLTKGDIMKNASWDWRNAGTTVSNIQLNLPNLSPNFWVISTSQGREPIDALIRDLIIRDIIKKKYVVP